MKDLTEQEFLERIRRDGGAAFPFQVVNDGGTVYFGLSARDWFAGQALTGILLDPKYGDQAQSNSAIAAQWAYAHADAMLAERSKQP